MSGKVYKSTVVKMEMQVDEAEGVVEGYASVFGNEDSHGEVVVPGAFESAIAEGFDSWLVMRNHWNLIGKPIEVREDGTGLYTRSKISKTQGEHGGEATLQLILDGALTGMSFGAYVLEQEGEELKQLRPFEYSFVDFPANDLAGVTAAKGADVATKDLWWVAQIISIRNEIKELEEWQEWILKDPELITPEDVAEAMEIISGIETQIEKQKQKVAAWKAAQPETALLERLKELTNQYRGQ